MNQTQQDLQAAVDSVHEAVVNAARGMLGSLSQQAGIGKYASPFVEYACQLRRLLPDYAEPGWLIKRCETFGPTFTVNQPTESLKLAQFVVPNMPKIEQPIFVGEAATLDLDTLFDEQRDRFQVPELFDAIISRLEEIIVADVIEHRTVQEAIQRLKAVLARNRRGSLASILLTMNYGRFVMNAFGGVLSANKYTKPIVESLRQELQTASEAVDRATEATKRETIRRLTNQQRLEMFIEEQPEARDAIAGYLPEPSPIADSN